MRHFLFITICFTGIALGAVAQNKIDSMVEEFSTIERAKFTSAVERDEKTHDVVKAVKSLNVKGMKASSIRSNFKAEARNHDTSETKEQGLETYVFTVKADTASRIYMLKYRPNDATVTIIINRKPTNKRK